MTDYALFCQWNAKKQSHFKHTLDCNLNKNEVTTIKHPLKE